MDIAALKFRHGARWAHPSRIRERNEAEARSGVRRFEPSLEASERAHTARSAVRERLESWAEHPDERVPLALLDNAHLYHVLSDSYDKGRIRRALLDRGLRAAEREGLIWTTLLDRLTASMLRAGKSSLLPEAEAQADRLQSWIQTAEEEALGALAEFEDFHLHTLIVRCARALTPELLRASLDAHPKLALEVPENEHLNKALLTTLSGWALDDDSSPGQRAVRFKVFGAIEEAGYTLPDGIVDRMIHAGPSEDYWRLEVTERTSLSEEKYRDLYSRLVEEDRSDSTSRGTYGLEKMAQNPATPIHVTRDAVAYLLDRDGTANQRFFLVESPHLRRDPEIRGWIRQSDNPYTLRALLQDRDLEDAASIFRRLVELDMHSAAKALKEHPQSLTRQVSRRDLLPLLEHELASVREAAITFLAQTARQAAKGRGSPGSGGARSSFVRPRP